MGVEGRKVLTGTCGCGQLTFHLASAPVFVHCCHCKECQKQTGAAYVLNAIFEADRVEREGETIEHPLPTPGEETPPHGESDGTVQFGVGLLWSSARLFNERHY